MRMSFLSLMASAIIYMLVNQWVVGDLRYCEYFNGEVIIVKSYTLCPMRITR